jgi:hypothetical protein
MNQCTKQRGLKKRIAIVINHHYNKRNNLMFLEVRL